MKIIVSLVTCLLIIIAAQAQDFSITSIDAVPTLKRGKAYNFNWKSNSPDQKVMLSLKDSRDNITAIGSVLNTGTAVVKIPSRIRPGRYQVALETNNGQHIDPMTIRIRRKVPLAWQITPLVVVAVPLIILSQDRGHTGYYEIPAPIID